MVGRHPSGGPKLTHGARFRSTLDVMKNLGVSLGALVSYNQQNFSASEAYNNWHNYELSITANYKLPCLEKLVISPSYTYMNAISDEARDAGVSDQSLYGIKAAYYF
jgi:hypothetical protein